MEDLNKMEKTLTILGFNITTESASKIIENSLSKNKVHIINTINPHSYVVQKKDLEFKKALLSSDYIIPDGSGIVLAAKIIKNKKIHRLPGYDLFLEVMRQLNEKSGKVMFFGSSIDTLIKIKLKAESEYSNLDIDYFSPPYKDYFDKEDLDRFIKVITQSNPDVLFIGLTAPKQEKLILLLRDKINIKLISGIGAVFDFYAETIKRPNTLFLKMNLEWLGRFLQEPQRLWKRNFISTPIFLYDTVIESVKKNIFHKSDSTRDLQ